MDFENMKVDAKEYIKQYRENAEKNGLVFKVYIENIDQKEFMKDHKNGEMFCTPNVSIKGNATALSMATLIETCEDAFEEFKKDPAVRMALMMLKLATKNGRKIDVTEEGKDD